MLKGLRYYKNEFIEIIAIPVCSRDCAYNCYVILLTNFLFIRDKIVMGNHEGFIFIYEQESQV